MLSGENMCHVQDCNLCVLKHPSNPFMVVTTTMPFCEVCRLSHKLRNGTFIKKEKKKKKHIYYLFPSTSQPLAWAHQIIDSNTDSYQEKDFAYHKITSLQKDLWSALWVWWYFFRVCGKDILHQIVILLFMQENALWNGKNSIIVKRRGNGKNFEELKKK